MRPENICRVSLDPWVTPLREELPQDESSSSQGELSLRHVLAGCCRLLSIWQAAEQWGTDKRQPIGGSLDLASSS